MALVLKDRVKETSTTTGTGTFTLAGASVGFQAFSVIGDGNTTYYTIQGGSEFEVGIGTYTLTGTTLSRDTILSSSNSNNAVNFSAGTKDVFVTYPAGKSINLDSSGNATALGTPVSGTLTNATGLPISTGVSGLGSNVATFLATPSSANLAAAVTDETGSGALVFATSPTLVTPALGTPSSGTLTSCTGLPLTTGVTGTLPVANGGTGVTAASTGTGGVVLSASPTLTGTLTGSAASFSSTVATGALTVTGAITATGNITAFFSDDRLKTRVGKIENALDKICDLEGFYYEPNETAQALGYEVTREVGLSAQSTQKTMPEIVAPAPIDDKYLTIRYEKYAPYFVEAIKELRAEIAELRAQLKAR